MRIVGHPYLAGVKCREDGAVWLPATRGRVGGPHWTFGSPNREGYRHVHVRGKIYSAHRLICEAFHGLCPQDKCQVDHIDRNTSNNRPENLRWCTPAENTRNRAVYSQYGVSSVNNNAAYQRALYANNPVFRERQKARNRANYAKKKSAG